MRRLEITLGISRYFPSHGRVYQYSRSSQEFAPIVRAIAALPKEIKQYALFAGPRLDKVTAHGSVALVGDASHRELFLDIRFCSFTC